MSKLIVFSGIDRMGKTTMINSLLPEIPHATMIQSHMLTAFSKMEHSKWNKDIFEVRHIGALDSMQNMFHTMIPLIPSTTFVADRLVWDEYAYGCALRKDSVDRVYGHENNLVRYTQEFEMECKKIFDDCVFVLFHLEKGMPNNDDYVTASQLQKVNIYFRKSYDYSHFRKILIPLSMHVHKTNIDQYHDQILSFINAR